MGTMAALPIQGLRRAGDNTSPANFTGCSFVLPRWCAGRGRAAPAPRFTLGEWPLGPGEAGAGRLDALQEAAEVFANRLARRGLGD